MAEYARFISLFVQNDASKLRYRFFTIFFIINFAKNIY